MSSEALPKPVLDPKKRTKIEGDPNHGLWGFFNSEKKALTTPEQEQAHGRSWTVEELRHKSWEELHSLWYICCKEHNRIATERRERERLGLCGKAYENKGSRDAKGDLDEEETKRNEARKGEREAKERTRVIRKTQQCIKHTLTERWYAWESAWKVAADDPEVNLSAEPGTAAYRPIVHEEAEVNEETPRAASSIG
ncbi:54S ribosomal protein L4 mitochondrial [Lecanora helva]